MQSSYVAGGVQVFPSTVPLPGLGLLPVNGFLVHGQEPYLVDTGLIVEGDDYLAAVRRAIELTELRWIYLTHADPDHTGALFALLEAAPQARVVTTFLGLGRLGLYRVLEPHRFLLLNPGQRLQLGDRSLTVFKPPLFDAPETTCVYDDHLEALFSSDLFGAPLEQWVDTANAIETHQLAEREGLWTSVDAPWIRAVHRRGLDRALNEFERLDPRWVYSSHLPPAQRMMRQLCANLRRAPDHAPFIGPDQRQFHELLEGAEQAPATC